MNTFLVRTILVLTTLITFSQSSSAHHAFAAEFDAKAPIVLKGTVAKTEMINPHAWIHIDVAKEDGSVEYWKVEGGTPNSLARSGITNDSLPIGTEVIIRGYQSKDKDCSRKCKANGREITLANGQKLFMGSSGTSAPKDGADLSEK